jgi:hypothetical protein
MSEVPLYGQGRMGLCQERDQTLEFLQGRDLAWGDHCTNAHFPGFDKCLLLRFQGLNWVLLP